MQISVNTDMKSTKEATFQQKTPKSIHSWSNHFWNPIAHVYVKVQYEKASIQKLKHSWKKLITIMAATIPINTMKKEKL